MTAYCVETYSISYCFLLVLFWRKKTTHCVYNLVLSYNNVIHVNKQFISYLLLHSSTFSAPVLLFCTKSAIYNSQRRKALLLKRQVCFFFHVVRCPISLRDNFVPYFCIKTTYRSHLLFSPGAREV